VLLAARLPGFDWRLFTPPLTDRGGFGRPCRAWDFRGIPPWRIDTVSSVCSIRHTMQAEHFVGKWLWFTVCAIVLGTVLFLFGLWCLGSTNIPSPPLALPLLQRFLSGLVFMLLNPLTVVPLALILTASRFLVSKSSWAAAIVASLVGLTFLLVGVSWVPNPIILWPMDILGEHMVPDLVGELFTFHIVPAPGGSNMAAAGFDPIFRWQIEECGARFSIIIMGWTLCLVTIWIFQERMKTAKLLWPKVAASGS